MFVMLSVRTTTVCERRKVDDEEDDDTTTEIKNFKLIKTIHNQKEYKNNNNHQHQHYHHNYHQVLSPTSENISNLLLRTTEDDADADDDEDDDDDNNDNDKKHHDEEDIIIVRPININSIADASNTTNTISPAYSTNITVTNTAIATTTTNSNSIISNTIANTTNTTNKTTETNKISSRSNSISNSSSTTRTTSVASSIISCKDTTSTNSVINDHDIINTIYTNNNNNSNNNTNNNYTNNINNHQNHITEKQFTKSVSFDKNINKSNLILTELNNFKQPPALQAPLATILNDLSPLPITLPTITTITTKVNNNKASIPPCHMTPKGLQDNSPDVKAMRYYRLWIYTCNAVLLMAVIVFCGVAGKVLLADYKRLLVNGLNLGQPSFIYAYLALLVQSGFLQLIGCLGALRLSEKLLNAYWLLLLVLLIGDAILGVFWMFKFERIMQGLQPMLRYRLATEYGTSVEFSELWDKLQNDGRCCGIIGPQDFTSTTNRSYPNSCCSADITEQISISRRPLASAVVFRSDDTTTTTTTTTTGNSINSLGAAAVAAVAQQTKQNFSDMTDLTWNHVVTTEAKEEIKTVAVCRAIYPQGCMDKMVNWLRNTADILFVLGYCVIAFLKLSFLGILRYEIKEMIQKIKLLQTELACSILGGPEAAEQQQIPNTAINNGGIHAEPKVGNRDRERNRIGSGESERESLLIHETTPKYLRQKSIHNIEQGDDISGVAKSINGNNNYELTEFDTKAPTYRLLSAPTVTKI